MNDTGIPAVIAKILSGAALALVLLGVGACSSSGGGQVATVEAPPSTTPLVGSVSANRYPSTEDALDLMVVVFDQGLTGTEESEQVFPTVRKAESLILPVILSDFLEDSGAFAVVRVAHSAEVHTPLALEAEIIRADGVELELVVELRGSDDRVLLRRRYRDEARSNDYPVGLGDDPFSDLYRAISNDVAAAVLALETSKRRELQRLSLLRFAADLAPGTFDTYLDRAPDGGLELLSYPADDDPMLGRLSRLRRQDELFVDTVDEQYSELRDEVSESYALWRQYSYELQRFGSEYRATASSRRSSARRGTYASMQQSYASYRKVKIQEEDFGALVKGFAGESLETVLEVDDGVVRLSGSVEERYREWRGILTRIYDLETGAL